MNGNPPSSKPNYRTMRTDIEGCDSLAELAPDLRWSCNHATDEVWRQLDPALWDFTQNPWVVLQADSKDKLKSLPANPAFRKNIDDLLQAKRRAAEVPAWFQKNHPQSPLNCVAYFSMEYMVTASNSAMMRCVVGCTKASINSPVSEKPRAPRGINSRNTSTTSRAISRSCQLMRLPAKSTRSSKRNGEPKLIASSTWPRRRGCSGKSPNTLARPGLARNREWARIVIEKPIGYDLDSARALNAVLAASFDESQIFRIDHYLGKETVQNSLAFRFSNPLFEPVWNRRCIDCVTITVAETVGVEHRGGYYDHAGALRDMVQNHLMQLLFPVAMEPMVSFQADEIRNKKVDASHATRPIHRDGVQQCAVRGHYGSGNPEEFVTQHNMKTPIEYAIVAVPFHADAATHDELAQKVNEKLNAGYELLGAPFLSEEMMYQAMTKPIQQASQPPVQ